MCINVSLMGQGARDEIIKPEEMFTFNLFFVMYLSYRVMSSHSAPVLLSL